MEIFVKHFVKIYGDRVLAYNVHSLLHLVDYAELFGSLDNISCFPFENFLGILKQLIRKHQKMNHISQIIWRLSEKYIATKDNSANTENLTIHKQQHYDGPVVNGYETSNQFKQSKYKKIFVYLSSNDNCFLIEDYICIVKNILCLSESTFLVVSMFDKKEVFILSFWP